MLLVSGDIRVVQSILDSSLPSVPARKVAPALHSGFVIELLNPFYQILVAELFDRPAATQFPPKRSAARISFAVANAQKACAATHSSPQFAGGQLSPRGLLGVSTVVAG